ncbi:MAG: GIY-YIG nuclease family protein [Kiritimatiellaeota bacterium]|nr:GIY-YIG nuclease family protein [Kiritimatiellota bacterium]
MSYWVYILLCADGRFYVGHTNNLKERVACHNAGRGALFTSIRRPVRLVHSEEFGTESAAVAREIQIKHWSHAKKTALVKGELQRLHALSISRDHKKTSPAQPLTPPSSPTPC